MLGARNDGWATCTPGELERLSLRLRAQQRAAGWVKAAAAILASISLIGSLYVTGTMLYVHFRDAPLSTAVPAVGGIKSVYIHPKSGPGNR
jgi:hypothetical protein